MRASTVPRWTPHAIVALCWLGMWQVTGLGAAPGLGPTDPERPAARILNARLAEEGTGPAEYVGTAQCLVCHATRLTEAPRSHPGLLEYAREGEWSGHACESCHGPGSIHLVGGGNMEGIIQPLKIPGEQANAICLECHAGTGWGTTHDWLTAPHNLAEVACVTCHDPHRETPHGLRPLDVGGSLVLGPPFSGPESNLTHWQFSSAEHAFASTEQFCFSCHSTQMLDFRLRSHHPIESGGLSCTDCHNPHQEALHGEDLLRGTNGLCESCHTGFAGPFRFNHAPVHEVMLGDGCLTCHEPHGSTNPSLLKINDRGLCLQCHIDQDTVGPDPHFPGTCWTSGCHQQVHGSDTSVYFLSDSFGGLAVMH